MSRKFGLNDCATVSLLYRFCGELSRLTEKPYTQRDGRINAVREYIDANFCSDDCLAKCTEIIGVTPRRFNDIFKSEFNMTPNRYIVLKRVDYARELLRTGNFSVTEVAKICGFCDVYYFSRVFKTETGVSPKEWRRG
jgi:AraC-like DNA-binding protein